VLLPLPEASRLQVQELKQPLALQEAAGNSKHSKSVSALQQKLKAARRRLADVSGTVDDQAALHAKLVQISERLHTAAQASEEDNSALHAKLGQVTALLQERTQAIAHLEASADQMRAELRVSCMQVHQSDTEAARLREMIRELHEASCMHADTVQTLESAAEEAQARAEHALQTRHELLQSISHLEQRRALDHQRCANLEDQLSHMQRMSAEQEASAAEQRAAADAQLKAVQAQMQLMKEQQADTDLHVEHNVPEPAAGSNGVPQQLHTGQVWLSQQAGDPNSAEFVNTEVRELRKSHAALAASAGEFEEMRGNLKAAASLVIELARALKAEQERRRGSDTQLAALRQRNTELKEEGSAALQQAHDLQSQNVAMHCALQDQMQRFQELEAQAPPQGARLRSPADLQ
jgi:chromosome segregation ATPase